MKLYKYLISGGLALTLYMSKSEKLTLKSRRTKGYSHQRKESTSWGM